MASFRPVALALGLSVAAAPALAAAPRLPQPAPATPAIVQPRDVAYPGLLTLSVDATDLDRRIFRVRETIPVARSGPMTLYFPLWRMGGHSPSGELNKLGGLVITAGGQRVEWTRDPVEPAAFHIAVPTGARTLDLAFEFLSATATDQGRVVVTPEMMNVQWNNMALYPAGHFTRRIQVQASIRLPEGWDYATALETEARDGDTVTFKPISFDNLVDSPMFAGRYVRKIDLDPGGRSRVTLDVVADEPGQLEAAPKHVEAMRAMVVQADRLFGARHYDHYDLLLALSDKLGGIGLEHQRSTEIGREPKFFLDWDKLPAARNVLPHEYVHSWNGKYRRPADLWTPTFNTPMRDSLLWVYEGQTQYWGYVLGARSTLTTRQEALDAIAEIAATYDQRVGRSWRQLADTTNDPIINTRRPIPWTSWQRSEDYYSEGLLIWLDADTLIRERSGGKKSLDDFAKAFFGVNDGDWNQLTYDFDDVVRALNAVTPYDWAGFLRTRLEGHGPAPLDGLARGGYRLVYADAPTDYFKNNETRRRVTDLMYSAGFVVDREGALGSVQWDGPAFEAGLAVGVRIVAVNGVGFDADRLKAAVAATRTGAPLELIVRSGDRYRTVKLDYAGGHRYPRLERIEGAPDRFGDILTPRAD
jgi:predicted metalloprotease with PDZ domain